MKTEKFVLPEIWASALINGDYSGLNNDDKEEIKEFLQENNLNAIDCLDCSEESYFSRYNDAHVLAGNVLEYTFKINS